jgi:hypothetical protein
MLDVVQLLLSHGALQLQDRDGRTPVKLVRKNRPTWYLLMGLDPNDEQNQKGKSKKHLIARSSDTSDTNLAASNVPALAPSPLNVKPVSSTQPRPTSKRAPLETVLEQWNEKTSTSTVQAPSPSIIVESVASKTVSGSSEQNVADHSHHTHEIGGGVLGGGRTLPQGTSKQVAIDDAVSNWLGGSAPEKTKKPLIKFLKPGDKLFHGGTHSRSDPTSPRKSPNPDGSVAQLQNESASSQGGGKEKIYTDTWGFVHSAPHHMAEASTSIYF